jgi:hypothetical protein
MCDEQLKHLRRRPPVEREVARQVRFAHGDDDGNVADEDWKTMPIYTNNLMHLRLTLACCMGVSRDVARTTLCVRAGLYAQLSPLLIDLPIGNDQIDVVILNHGTPGEEDHPVLAQLLIKLLHKIFANG